jgi:Werner syndrome ATP-dependent helicase
MSWGSDSPLTDMLNRPASPQELALLKRTFNIDEFTISQWQVIRAIIDQGTDVLAILPPASGKTLILQYPAMHSSKPALIISPLTVLIESQVAEAVANGIRTVILGGGSPEEQLHGQARLASNDVDLVYCSPEHIGKYAFCVRAHLSGGSSGLSHIAVDEAHLTIHWGDQFRPAYSRLGRQLRAAFPGVPIVATTATASPAVERQIVHSLQLVEPMVVRQSSNKPNVSLNVTPKSGTVWGDIELASDGSPGSVPTVVYCSTKQQAAAMVQQYRLHDITVALFHAGLELADKQSAHADFMSNKVAVLVATVAWGLGVNKPDIRLVIQYGAPDSLDSYFQQVGRAGRDGLPASSCLLWSNSDMIVHTRRAVTLHSKEAVRAVKVYINSKQCRRKVLLDHLDGDATAAIEAQQSVQTECCDVCTEHNMAGALPAEQQVSNQRDFGKLARQLLTACHQVTPKRGVALAVKLLRGNNDARLTQDMRNSPIFAQGQTLPTVFWKALAEELEKSGHLIPIHQQAIIRGGSNVPYIGVKVTDIGHHLLSQPDEPLVLPVGGDLDPDRKEATVVPVQKRLSDLGRALQATRSRLARTEQVAPHVVLSDLALRQVEAAKPTSVTVLAQLPAIGKEQCEHFGAAICKVIDDFVASSGGPANCVPSKEAIEAEMARVQLGKPAVQTLQLLLASKSSIDDAAGVRGTASSTVYNHLNQALTKGFLWTPLNQTVLCGTTMLDIARIIHSEAVQSVVTRLKPIMEAVSAVHTTVTYCQLDLAVAMLKGLYGTDNDGRLKWSNRQYATYTVAKPSDVFDSDSDDS